MRCCLPFALTLSCPQFLLHGLPMCAGLVTTSQEQGHQTGEGPEKAQKW